VRKERRDALNFFVQLTAPQIVPLPPQPLALSLVLSKKINFF
jgi:hypothetical protein